jgi:hypothetical protein
MSAQRRGLAFAAGLTVAVGALTGVLARMTVFVPLDRAASTVEALLGATLVTVLALLVAAMLLASLTVVPLYAVVSGRFRAADASWLVVGCLGVVLCVAVGFVGIQGVAGEFAEATTDTYGGYAGPSAAFEVEERAASDGRVVVRFSHDGGDPLLAENVEVRGEGFTDIEGVDHAGPGAWRGDVSGERPRRGGAAIVRGDAVTVGAAEDCEIRLVYADDGVHAVACHRCGEA